MFHFKYKRKNLNHVLQVVDMLGKKMAFALLKKTIQHFVIFLKLIKEMPLFWNLIFSKSS